MIQRIALAVAATLAAGCTVIPVDQHTGGEMILSPEVVRQFYDPEAEEIVATEDRVRCFRHKRVGTHMVTRTCMTVAEWDEQERLARETQQDRMTGPCGATLAPGREFMDSDVPMALLPSTCGESINRPR